MCGWREAIDTPIGWSGGGFHVEDIDSRSGNLAAGQSFDQRRLSRRSVRASIDQAADAHQFKFGARIKAMCGRSPPGELETTSASRNSSALETSRAPAAAAACGVRFWLHVDHIHAERKAHLATCEPTLPNPMMPRSCPPGRRRRIVASRRRAVNAFSETMCRALARMSAQVSSTVGADVYDV